MLGSLVVDFVDCGITCFWFSFSRGSHCICVAGKCKGQLIKLRSGRCGCKRGFFKKGRKCIKSKRLPATQTNTNPKPAPIKTPQNANPDESAGGETTTGGETCASKFGSDQCKLIQQVLDLTNSLRRKSGKNELCLNNKLILAAKIHTEDMVKNNYFDHTGSDGSSPWDRMDKVKFSIGDAENVAYGQYTPQAVYNAWYASSGHRENMLGSHDMMGAYFLNGKWTQTFGTSRGEKCNT